MWLTVGLSIVAFILLCIMAVAYNAGKKWDAERLKLEEQNSK